MAVQFAKYYASRKTKHTRLIFLSFDARELRLKGSRAFFRRRRKELPEIQVWHFNVDCSCIIDEIKFLTEARNKCVSLSGTLTPLLMRVVYESRYETAKAMRIMFLRGETDAGKAARAETETMTLLGLPFP
jgi:hypothetical protein